MDFKERKELLSARFDANLKQIQEAQKLAQDLTTENIKLQANYKLLEDLEKESQQKSTLLEEPKASTTVATNLLKNAPRKKRTA